MCVPIIPLTHIQLIDVDSWSKNIYVQFLKDPFVDEFWNKKTGTHFIFFHSQLLGAMLKVNCLWATRHSDFDRDFDGDLNHRT